MSTHRSTPGRSAITQPAFFTRVQREAAEDWTDWESTPRRGAPVLQLFRQIKSPHHVLSELLQNADDAGASWVRTRIENDAFVFEHDGADFEEEHFASLCRFGYSNKRHLHTIGFRGLGFKSLFSYGPTIELTTPTLTVDFEERRFTEPVWRADLEASQHVRISIQFADERIARRAVEDLERWSTSPVPLLFFRSVRKMTLGEVEIAVEVLGDGPVPRSQWVRLCGTDEDRVLVVRSAPLPLPEAAMTEIRSERMDDSFTAGDVELQLVLGLEAENRAYVVLPTNVAWTLPFSGNAPFVQDPARTGIKDPDNSPLNRWLLEQLGRLAGETLLEWVRREDLSVTERAEAYELLPPSPPSVAARRLEARCVIDGLAEALDDHDVLLARGGGLVATTSALDLPSDLVGIWEDDVALSIFATGQAAVLAAEVPANRRAVLAAWGYIERLDRAKVCELLHARDAVVPHPGSDALIQLWEYVQPQINSFWWYDWPKRLRIVPVQGGGELYAAADVLVVDKVPSEVEPDDWAFLSEILPLVDRAWLAVIDHYVAASDSSGARGRTARAIATMLTWLGLNEDLSLADMIQRAADRIQASGTRGQEMVRLAHIAARCGVNVPHDFPYRTANGSWVTASDTLLALEEHQRALLPAGWIQERTLHAAYQKGLSRSARDTWQAWCRSPHSRMSRFECPVAKHEWLVSASEARAEARELGGTGSFTLAYSRADFYLEEIDYPEELWQHWEELAKDNDAVWEDVLRAIATMWSVVQHRTTATFTEKARVNSRVLETVPAAWVRRFRAMPCLRDDHGVMAVPATLLRRTPGTTDLFGIEPFINESLDRSELHPLLDLLGVRSTPSDANSLLERLRGLTRAPSPPEEALGKLYSAMDRLVGRLESDAVGNARAAFEREPLIRGSDGAWHRSTEVFIDNPERLPGVVTVWERAGVLALWGRLGVAPRPTNEMLLNWLGEQPKGEKLSPAVRDRVRALLASMPEHAALRCEAWLDLDGGWRALRDLRWYAREATDASRLFADGRRRTADVSMLPATVASDAILPSLLPLDKSFEWREQVGWGQIAKRPEWIDALATCMLKVKTDSLTALPASGGEQPHPDHLSAHRLGASQWESRLWLQLTPYLAGTPAGPARSVKACWQEQRLVVVGSSDEYLDDLTAALTRPLKTAKLRDAVATCVEREPSFIERYFRRHFDLADLPFSPADEEATAGSNRVVTNEVDAEESVGSNGRDVSDDTAGLGAPTIAAMVKEQSLPIGNLGHEDDLDSAAGDELRGNGQPGRPRASRKAPVQWIELGSFAVADMTAAQGGTSVSLSPRVLSPVGREAAGEKPVHVREHWRSESGRRELLLAALHAHGYVLHNAQLRHEDGGWAELLIGDIPHATAYGPDALPRAHYWAGDADLPESVEMPSEVWQFFELMRTRGWVVLPGREAARLLSMEQLLKEAEVHPASFRLTPRVTP